MRITLLVLCVLAVTALAADSFLFETPIYCGGTDELLQYDDGTGFWFTWSGIYRGVWFNTEDFLPGSASFTADYTEFWFFHYAGLPWDTSDFYAELWNGGVGAPVTRLDQQVVTAVHLSAVQATYATPIVCEAGFWGIINTEMSSGNLPSSIGDNTENPPDHSFFSDDFVIWEPWVVSPLIDSTYCDLLIRASGLIIMDLETESWAAIKSICR